MRTAAVYLFILAVGGVAAFCAQKRTVAHGDALAGELL